MGNAGMTAASSTSEASCAAVLLACQKLLPTLLTAKAAAEQAKACQRVKRDSGLIKGESRIGEDDVAVEEGDVARWEEVAAQAKAMELTLSAQAHFQPDPSHASYFTFGAAVSEVEVDVLTGAVAVLRADIHYDCARSLNPAVDIGQVEGAFVQGQGFFTTEEVLLEEATGKLLSDGTWAYKVPSFDTVPRQLNVSLLHGTANKQGVLSSKSSGEPPLLLAVSIHSAIRHAIAAARHQLAHPTTQAGSATGGVWGEFVRLNSPATMPVVQRACGSQLVEAYLEKQLAASAAAGIDAADGAGAKISEAGAFRDT
ncbi:unnamed protein product [Closterium sp. NIES-65]|nr:unnamed protein product [Closterium sp. NIES-65]